MKWRDKKAMPFVLNFTLLYFKGYSQNGWGPWPEFPLDPPVAG